MIKIILKSSLNLYQKFWLLLCFLLFFALGMRIFENNRFSENIDYSYLLLFLICFVVVLFFFNKNGLIIKNNKLYQAKFIFGFCWFKLKKNITGITDITILTIKGVKKYAFVSDTHPDKGYDVINYDIYMLNEKHTVKKYLATAKNKKQANDAIVIINEVFNFKFGLYNPRFYD